MEDVKTKNKYGVDKKSIISLVIFLICILKYYLFNIIEIYPKYGNINRLVSWVLIMPLILTGLILSLKVIFNTFKNNDVKANILNIILVFPLLLFILYFFFYL